MLNRPPCLLVFLALALGVSGCATQAVAPAPVRETPPVRLIVTNRTPHAWQIRVRPRGDSAPRTAHVAPHRVIELPLARGDYVIEQTLLDPGSAAVAQREFAMSFDADGEYQWELATLLSSGETPSPPTAMTETASRD